MLERLWPNIPAVGNTLLASFPRLQEAWRQMRARQAICAGTGAHMSHSS